MPQYDDKPQSVEKLHVTSGLSCPVKGRVPHLPNFKHVFCICVDTISKKLIKPTFIDVFPFFFFHKGTIFPMGLILAT